jgi:hypothetical protein
MNVIDHISSRGRFADIWGDLIDLQTVYANSRSFEQRETVAARTADLLDEAAGLLEGSALIRATVSATVGSPTELRAEAASWRRGVDPNGEG